MADYWDSLRALVAESRIVVDRKRNTAHPKYRDMVYPVDYGYLEGTRSMDGAASTSSWHGSATHPGISASSTS
jgi:inorganic pyrophosphatase